MRRDGDKSGDIDTGLPELLATYLDSIETVIRDELATPRLANPRHARNGLQRFDLMDALDSVAAAREELARCPEGAKLAFAVLGIELHRLRLHGAASKVLDLARPKGRAGKAIKERASWKLWQQIADRLPNRKQSKAWAVRRVREELDKMEYKPLPEEKTIYARITYPVNSSSAA